MEKSILLIGYRAVGKSSVARTLAAQLHYSFIDTDEQICQEQGKNVRQIVKDEGWACFRKYEKNILKTLVGVERSVIATGGGAVLHSGVWAELKKNNLVVWLTAESATLCKRLQSDPASRELRPSLSGGNFCEELTTILSEREPLYRQYADIVIDTTHSRQVEVVGLILEESGLSIHP